MSIYEWDERVVGIIYKMLAEEETSEAEDQLLNEWLAHSQSRRQWFEEIMQRDLLPELIKINFQRDTKEAWNRLLEKNGQVAGSARRSKWITYFAAAAVLLFIIAGTYFYTNRADIAPMSQEQSKGEADKLPPGGNKAILELADGTRIMLDSAGIGILAHQGNMKVQKTTNGQLVYSPAGNQDAGPTDTLFNTITTPKGGQYRLVLPDGTRVWLNAASSIRFPSGFSDGMRKVTLHGEAYFETIPQSGTPFIITVGSMQVQVLGTKFNVNAYEDEENIRTTLIQGSVKVTRSGQAVLLKPGQQSIVPYADIMSPIQVRSIDTEQAVAWQKGLFSFKGTDIKTIMRQIARWYDVEVIYKGAVKDRFIGEASRDASLGELLNIMELTGKVRFRVSGRQVTVIPDQ